MLRGNLSSRPFYNEGMVTSAIAFVAILAVAVWFVRSVPRTLGCLAIATLFALGLNPLIEALRRRTNWHRRTAAGVVLILFAIIGATGLALVTVPTIREARDFKDQIPATVKDLGKLPIVGTRLREANAEQKVEDWLNDVPKKLSVDATPVENVAGSVADGVAAALLDRRPFQNRHACASLARGHRRCQARDSAPHYNDIEALLAHDIFPLNRTTSRHSRRALRP